MNLLKLRLIFPLIFFLLFSLSYTVSAQYKTYSLNENGDTINGINNKGLKHGKWVERVEELRGEPGYEEEGIYKDGQKDGIWRKYNLLGDLIGVEQFIKGGKHGLQQYYTYLGDLIREESWIGYDPADPYDTIPIYGTGSNEVVDFKIVKAEPYSVKNGEWRYYEEGTGRLIRTEKWDRNNLVKPGQKAEETTVKEEKPKKAEKTAEMLEWESKNKGKKRVMRDGKTGI